MEKELYYNHPYPVRHDDLKFDGKNIIIPSNWSNSLYDFLKEVDTNNLEVGDREDYKTMLGFLMSINQYQGKKVTPTTFPFEGTN
jgi:hypothetical protein